MYPVSTTWELDAVRAVVCCAWSCSPKGIQADYMYDLIMVEFFRRKEHI